MMSEDVDSLDLQSMLTPIFALSRTTKTVSACAHIKLSLGRRGYGSAEAQRYLIGCFVMGTVVEWL